MNLNTMKKTTIVMILTVLAFTIMIPATAFASSRKTYYLGGVSVFGGSSKKNSAMLIYRNSSHISVKGTWDKGISCNKWGGAEGQTKTRKVNRRFKVSKNCKVVEVQMPKSHIVKWSRWRKTNDCKKNKEIVFIGCTLKIKKGKIVRIYFGA